MLYSKIVYNDSETDYSKLDIKEYEDKFIKIVVADKNDYYMFDNFVDRLQQDIRTYELKIIESFSEFSGENNAENIDTAKDTTDILNEYIEAVDTDLNKDVLKIRMKTLYNEAQNMEIL